MLTDKLAQYREMKSAIGALEVELRSKVQEMQGAIDALEVEIKSEVLALGKSQKAEGVEVAYRKGVSKVDYQAAAIALAVPTGEFESIKTDYTAAVKAVKPGPEALKPFTTTGEPSVSIKLT